MFETMLRSGVPPHIGQSPPPPGSEATMRAGRAPRASINSSTVRSLKRSDRNRRRGFVFICQNLLSATCALICHELEVVEICTELCIHEESRRALSIPDRIHFIDQPLGGLGV